MFSTDLNEEEQMLLLMADDDEDMDDDAYGSSKRYAEDDADDCVFQQTPFFLVPFIAKERKEINGRRIRKVNQLHQRSHQRSRPLPRHRHRAPHRQKMSSLFNPGENWKQ
jgi:hypothetical protein